MVVKLQMRRGTAVQWTSANPTLAVGEMGIETDTRLFKIGDGTTAWISSDYITAGSVIDIAHGGTGETTASGAFNALLTPGTSGYILETRDSGYAPVWIAGSVMTSGFAPIASPTFTGIPAAPTAPVGTSTTQVATTAFVQCAMTSGVDGAITYRTTSGWVSVAAGTSGYILETRDSGYAPVWIAQPASGVTDATAIAYAIVFGG